MFMSNPREIRPGALHEAMLWNVLKALKIIRTMMNRPRTIAGITKGRPVPHDRTNLSPGVELFED
jgi:hypothetical protein